MADQICERLLLAQHGGLGWLRRELRALLRWAGQLTERAHRRADPLAGPIWQSRPVCDREWRLLRWSARSAVREHEYAGFQV